MSNKSKKHTELEKYLGIEIRRENIEGLYELKEAFEACDKEIAVKNALKLYYQLTLVTEYADKIMRTGLL